MRIADKLDKNKEKINSLIEKRVDLCRKLAEKIYEEYGDRIEEWDMVGKVEPVVWEDEHENPLWKEAKLHITFSRDYFQNKYGYDPTERKYDDNLYEQIGNEKDTMYSELLDPLWEEIRGEYDTDNYWFGFKIQDPTLNVV